MDNLDRKALEMMGRKGPEDSPCPKCKNYSLLVDWGMVHCVVCDYSEKIEDENKGVENG